MSGNRGKFKVVATDTHLFPLREELEALGALDCTVVSAVCKSEDETIAACRDAHVVLDTSAKITRKVIGELTNALAICRYGVGVDTVDIPAATEHGIIVANVPDFCFDEVADTAMSLILSVPRKVHRLNALVHQGVWNKEVARPVHKFRGATLGLFAFGNIAPERCRKAAAFGFRILAYDPYLTPERVREYPVTLVDFDTLLRESDLISVHAPLTDETRHQFNEAAFRRMKPSAFFFNLGRGPDPRPAGPVPGADGGLDRGRRPGRAGEGAAGSRGPDLETGQRRLHAALCLVHGGGVPGAAAQDRRERRRRPSRTVPEVSRQPRGEGDGTALGAQPAVSRRTE